MQRLCKTGTIPRYNVSKPSSDINCNNKRHVFKALRFSGSSTTKKKKQKRKINYY